MEQSQPLRGRAEQIDNIDINILAALFGRARISKVEMSSEVGISAGRCYERMRRLERAGIIRGYHADVDIPRLASALQFLVQVKLTRDIPARTQQFERTVLKFPQILSCHSVLGNIDYVLVVVAASIESYQAIIAELRMQSGDDFDFVTFPVSKAVKTPGQSDLRQVIARIARASVPAD
jgi:Lrp/AsnC family transcriptional regulator, regulator of ectoine-degradation genes